MSALHVQQLARFRAAAPRRPSLNFVLSRQVVPVSRLPGKSGWHGPGQWMEILLDSEFPRLRLLGSEGLGVKVCEVLWSSESLRPKT